eukprot:m.107707 g.107707  ORF g.107707 m.107707 type:complete len:52 (-) comp15317_c0_seq23:1467-1622(-)
MALRKCSATGAMAQVKTRMRFLHQGQSAVRRWHEPGTRQGPCLILSTQNIM